jgi:hypothetical protein
MQPNASPRDGMIPDTEPPSLLYELTDRAVGFEAACTSATSEVNTHSLEHEYLDSVEPAADDP